MRLAALAPLAALALLAPAARRPPSAQSGSLPAASPSAVAANDAGVPAAPSASSIPPSSSAPPAPVPPSPVPPATPTATDPLASDDARFDSDAALPAHADDVVDYTLEATLDPVSHTVHGEGSITWRNASSVPVNEVWVHLYLNAFKNQRSVWLRGPMLGSRGEQDVDDWGAIDVRRFALKEEGGITTDLWPNAELHRPGDEDETDVRVPLPHEVAPGEKLVFDVVWDDKMPSVVERTGYSGSFHMIAQWFPKIARLEPDGRWAHFPFYHAAEFYADYGTYDVTLDVPQKFLIGATGPAIDTTIAAGRRVERHVQKDVHDFAWTAWDEWQTEKEVIDGVRVAVLYPPSYKIVAQRELSAIRFALPDFGARYGRYPYEVLTLVHPPVRAPEAGGMEYPTLITTGGEWYGPPGIYELEITTMHEFGHQYFYGLIGTNEVEWPFLDEGLNSYAEQLAMGAWLGPGSASDLFGLKVSDAAIQAILGNEAAHDTPIAQPAYDFPRNGDVAGLIYERPASILETLRRTSGDELVRKAMGRYARKYRFQHPGPEALLGVFRDVMGDKVASNLRTAFFEEGWVDYAVTSISGGYAQEPAGMFDRDGKRETLQHAFGKGYVGSVLVQRRGTLSFPVDVALVRVDGTEERVHWDGESKFIRIPYEGDVPLRSAVVDPDNRVLLDQKPTNNFLIAGGQSYGWAPRTLERVLYWTELAIQGLLP